MPCRPDARADPAPTPNRPATEAALQRAVIDLLERHGVLVGLNLPEVADEAGANRGLVYHYFGSRRDLLPAALWRGPDVRMRPPAGLVHGPAGPGHVA